MDGQATDCALLALPLELRLRIYDFVYEDNAPWGLDFLDAKAALPSRSLHSTCRLLYTEAVDVQKKAQHEYCTSHGFRIDYDALAHLPILEKINRLHNSYDALACVGLTAFVIRVKLSIKEDPCNVDVPYCWKIDDEDGELILRVNIDGDSPHTGQDDLFGSLEAVGVDDRDTLLFLEAVRLGVAKAIDWEQAQELVEESLGFLTGTEIRGRWLRSVRGACMGAGM
ncbi:hypothetical protein EJ03DRAFT_217761 [Teratosphaeria nubilosa]|uniref:F-box domain-containing protein n=1 Tax=Teratosphaeria nubilosa TaxID=161662 RepID=A0A6G1KXP7_9PEZI|nr:hypothetical protein EJ03DRAFT_217761 [Teratosphaeria nubilosa]